MDTTHKQKAGTRAQRWILEGDITRLIEGTGEHPIMYRSLGSEPRTAHPFHLYDDIKSQSSALKDTFELNLTKIPALAARLVDKGMRGMAGHGLGTSQFVAQTASAAFWEYAGWEAKDYDSLEYVTCPHPIDFTRTVFFSYSGSGSTVDSNRAAARAKELGAYQVAFTSVADSPITKKSDEDHPLRGRVRHGRLRHFPLRHPPGGIHLAGPGDRGAHPSGLAGLEGPERPAFQPAPENGGLLRMGQ